MERKIFASLLAVLLASGAVLAQDTKKKKPEAAAPETGPLSLPTLAAVKEKCKPTEAQGPKLEALYAEATKNEADIRRRAKESESDRKTLEKFLADGRLDMVLKIKEVLDGPQKKTFDDLATAAAASGKKK